MKPNAQITEIIEVLGQFRNSNLDRLIFRGFSYESVSGSEFGLFRTNCTLCEWKKQKLRTWHALKLMLANQRPRSRTKLDKSVSQSAARIRMMSHHMNKPCETLPCASDYHDTRLASLISIALPIQLLKNLRTKQVRFGQAEKIINKFNRFKHSQLMLIYGHFKCQIYRL